LINFNLKYLKEGVKRVILWVLCEKTLCS
jgi:hypothetical protein